jgi:hypothetical protein
MATKYHQVTQGTPEWLALRCGKITASEVGKLLTSGGKIADNETSRGYIAELAAQRITAYIEPVFVSDDMLRGHEDEILARALYSEHHAPVTEVGFATMDVAPGVEIGASPDGLVGSDGLIEVKSRRQRLQLQTIAAGVCPPQYRAQIQMQLLVTGRQWCDFISYCSGMPMFVSRVYADDSMQCIIIDACMRAEDEIAATVKMYDIASRNLIPTERRKGEHGEII